MYNIPHQSKWTEKTFQQPRSSLTLPALSDMMAEQAKDNKNRLSKARNACRMMNNVWKSSQYSTKTKLRLCQSCVLSTLLYGSKFWRMTEWPEQVVHLPYKEPQKDPVYFLAWDYLQPTTSGPLQPREHGDHHHAKAMEMDRTCHPQRAGQHHKPSPCVSSLERKGPTPRD